MRPFWIQTGKKQLAVYMRPPLGLYLLEPDLVCKLNRSLYELKQASRQWNTKLAASLTTAGYSQSKHDYSMFTKLSTTSFTVILVYVDDLVLSGDDLGEINRIKHYLHDLYKIKDLGELKYFLGMKIARSRKGIAVCQRKHCLDLLQDYGMLDAKPASTPMDYTTHLSKKFGTLLASNSEYRRIIGRLLYLTNTKSEIAYAVSKLSQFLDCATDKNFEAALRVLKYLKGALAKGLFFSATTDFTPSGFSDSDWATCSDSRRSVTGHCFFLGTSIISWKSKKQDTVAASSCEAEYRALASATKDAQWLAYMMKELQIEQQKLIVIYCDSQSALHIAVNPVYHERTKHIEVDCHIARDKWQEGVTKLLPIASSEQTADILTKALAPSMFKSCESKLGLMDIHSPSLRGGVT
ncbi:uncharacterized protein LOC107637059 [Arachis ipaensis]|uniref:uncharacterized protein LOC107637059 n=1 Tax=Arachis ipaensis TaxID=130454 RepID=UPI0007AFCAA8|nr:uncharacterized protein LOC107637059 [Arachis ipaensis]